MHIPVLLCETIELLNPKGNEIIVDATVNGGGFAEAILNIKNFKGTVVGIDQDENLIEQLKNRLGNYIKNGRLKLVCGNFENIDEHLRVLNIKKADAFIFDLGMSSEQLLNSGRGFSFLRDEPLLMSYKSNLELNDLTAYKIINNFNGEEIYKILREYGEERFANRIVRNILDERRKKRIEKTFELVEIIKKSVPYGVQKKSKINPATKTFQALRIAVNRELDVLKVGINKAYSLLNKNGHLAVISFHSLEDRIVKNFFRDLKTNDLVDILTKKPITAKNDEVKNNPRSRTAKLRVIKIYD